jgi:hypothetical protein
MKHPNPSNDAARIQIERVGDDYFAHWIRPIAIIPFEAVCEALLEAHRESAV